MQLLLKQERPQNDKQHLRVENIIVLWGRGDVLVGESFQMLPLEDGEPCFLWDVGKGKWPLGRRASQTEMLKCLRCQHFLEF